MPVVRPRGHNKRSSSYGPTMILGVFIVLCILGGWKLTSNNSIQIPLARFSSENSGRKDKHSFEDNPGDLQHDIAKVDGQIPVRDNDSEEKTPDELPDSNGSNVDALSNTNSDKDSNVDIEKLKEESSVVEENVKDSELKESLEEAEKQREGESQVSEQGSVAQDQGQEQTVQESSESQGSKNSKEKESRGYQDAGKEEKEDAISSSDSGEKGESNEDQISSLDGREKAEKNEDHSWESSEKLQDDQQRQDHNVQDDSEPEDTSRKNDQGDSGNQDTGKDKDEEQRSYTESNEKDQQIEEKGVSEDEHDSMSQQQERSGENEKYEDMNKQTSEAEKREDELIRQRQEDAGIVQDGSQQTQNETSVSGNAQHQEMSSSTSSDKTPQNASGHHEYQDETSSALITHKKKKKHKKGPKHKQQTKATVGESSHEEDQHKEGSNHDTMVNDKLSESEKDHSQSGGENTETSRDSAESENTWSSQASESKHQKDRHSDDKDDADQKSWQLCNVTAGPDYIPCLDNLEALKHVHITGHYEHRERHCPDKPPTCLVPLPNGYKTPVQWPASRDKIWYNNVPHPMLAGVKGHQNWVKVMGEFLTFPGGGTQFIHGALHYIQYVEESEPKIAWGKHTRVILDVGCGVASFGGFLFEKDVLAMSFAPKDEHEAQVQFALERGIPAISAVMGSQRLSYPSNVFDLLHCARCRVPWHREGGMLLLELNRVLRPGGYFVWSATPVYQNLEEDVAIWKDMEKLTKSMCWKLVSITKDKLNSIGAAIYQKPSSNECYDQRTENNPPMCKNDDDPNAAWYVPLRACIHQVPENGAERGSRWPESWPLRLQTPPHWLNNSQKGIYGKPAPEDFATDYEQWKELIKESYMDNLGFNWSSIRNVMDMRSVYGGFAAALRDLKLWVMNVVNVDSADTLPIIYERGLFGMYHDWCESFSTYPRSYDLLHADNLFTKTKTRCKTIVPLIVEVDRIVRPGGKFIVRDEPDTIKEVENLLKSLQWKVLSNLSKDQYHILSAEKSFWRPNTYAASS